MSAHSTSSLHSSSSPLKTYFAVWIALLVGTGLTVYAATLDLGRFNAAVALGIATAKATIAALFFLLLLLGLTMSDYATRPWS
jgi:caa(3)-type oxidase subunit IV